MLITQLLGLAYGKDFIDIIPPFAHHLTRLRRVVDTSIDYVAIDLSAEGFGNTIGNVVRLIISTPEQLEQMQRDWDDNINIIVKTRVTQLSTQQNTKLLGYKPLLRIFRSIYRTLPLIIGLEVE